RLRSTAIALAAVLTTAASSAMAQVSDVTVPATRPGQLATEWTRLCGSPDAAALQQWLTTHLSAAAAARASAAERVTNMRGICAPNGGFRVAGIKKSDTSAITVLLVGKKSATWFEMTVGVNGAGQLDGFGLGLTTPDESTMPHDLSDAALVRDVRSIVARMSEAGLFSGIVAVARDTQIVVMASGGYANRATRTPITGSTQFTLG
ncbi:MAG: hypothetical protein ACRDPA_13075, partial [Solirubrobacteraceae bacterium]